MPLYEYQCLECAERIEVIQRIGDPPPSCPECGAAMKKLLSAPAFQFKGSGWYVTDYARKGSGGAGESKTSAEGGGDTADAGAKKESGAGKESGGASESGATSGTAKTSGSKSSDKT